MFKLPFASLLGVIITHLSHDVHAHGFDRCPSPCSVSGLNPVNWTTYSHLDRLKSCDRALMVDFSIYAPVDKSQRVRSCAIWGSDFENTVADVRTPEKLAQGYTTTTQSVNLDLTWWNGRDESESRGDSVDAILTMNEVQSYLARTSKEHNNTTMLFAASGNVAIGIYVGAAVVNNDVPDAVVQPLINKILTSSLSQGSLAQVCGANRTDQDTVGIIATTNNGFTLVQAALRTWSEAKCVSGGDGSLRIPNTTISTTHLISNSTTNSNGTYEPIQLYKRADCRTLTVAKGDYCSKLASDCGISLDQFQKYNPGANFCSLLQPHQKVCCTSGTIPKPKKNSDGSCASYITVTGDTCSALASSNGITVDDIENFNKDTWGE